MWTGLRRSDPSGGRDRENRRTGIAGRRFGDECRLRGACRRHYRPTFRGVDLLVNNAGVVIYGEVPEFTEEDWDTVLDTNLKGCFLMAKFSIPEMRKRGGGAMADMASVQALISQRQVAAYSASKGGVVSLTKTLALDHAKENIRVNSVLPGSVRTPMLERAARLEPGDPEEKIAEWGRIHPRGTVIEPEEIASVVLFLLSDDASAVTGGAYTADVGLSVQAAF